MTDLTYTFSLFRPREAYRDFVLTYGDHQVEYRPGFQRGAVMMAKRLVEAGMPDGRIEIIEKGGPLHQRPEPTLFEMATREPLIAPLPVEGAAVENDSDEGGEGRQMSFGPGARRWLTKLVETPAAWAEVPGVVKGLLSGLAYVEAANKGYATVTEAGKAALAEPVEDEEDTTGGLTPRQREAIEIAASVNAAAWAKLHGKTRNYAVKAGWVEMRGATPVLTEAGRGIAKEIGVTVSDAPVEIEATEEQEETVASGNLTPRQREAIEIAAKRPMEWTKLHGKTRNYMVKVGWVEMHGEAPVLTAAGREVATQAGVRA